MWDSRFTQFKIDYAETANLDVQDAVSSEDIAAGGHLWRINCYPRGWSYDGDGKYVSLFLELRSESTAGVKVIFDAFVLDVDGEPYWFRTGRLVRVSTRSTYDLGWPKFARRRDIEEFCVADDGCVTFVCGIVVMAGGGDGDAITVPPPDIGRHIARLMDCTDGTDVTFSVGGEAFPAHRAVVAARSPVFKAELFGSTSDATSSSITMEDIDPSTFRFMLRYIYTDALPGDDELGASPMEAVQNLLAAADRYALDRLKLMCAQKLWEHVNEDTVASTLAFAETYNCPELKNKCIGFFAVEQNLRKVIFTDGFLLLMQKFPSLAAELKERVGMCKRARIESKVVGDS